MLNLKDFILEALSDMDMEDYIVQALQDPERLHKTYKFLTRTEFPFNEYNEFLKARGLTPSDGKYIRRIFKDNDDDLDILLQIISKSESVVLPTSEELLSNPDQNIFTLFENTTHISKETLREIADLTPPKSGVARGRFEILCCLLLQDIMKNNAAPGKSSDVNTDGLGKLEFKMDGGRVKGQDLAEPGKIDSQMLKNIINKYFNPKNKEDQAALNLIGKGNIFSVKPKKQINNIQTILNDIIVKRIAETVPDRGLAKELQQLLADSIIYQFDPSAQSYKKDLEAFFVRIWNEIFDDRNKEFKSEMFSKVFGVIDTFFYQKSDDWDCMVIFAPERKDGQYTILTKDEVQDFYQIWMNPKIKFTGFVESGSPYGFAVHIHKA